MGEDLSAEGRYRLSDPGKHKHSLSLTDISVTGAGDEIYKLRDSYRNTLLNI